MDIKLTILILIASAGGLSAADKTVNWNVAGPADWDTAANWSPSEVPNNGADSWTVNIANGGIAELGVTAPTVTNFQLSNGGLRSGMITQTLTIAGGGSFSWSGGSLLEGADVILSAGTTGTVSGNVSYSSGFSPSIITNNGAFTWSSGNVTNAGMGGFEIVNTAGSSFHVASGANGSVLQGAVELQSGSSMTVDVGVDQRAFIYALENSATVSINTGTLAVQSDNIATSTGNFSVSAGAALEIILESTSMGFNLSSSQVTGAGKLLVTGDIDPIGPALIGGNPSGSFDLPEVDIQGGKLEVQFTSNETLTQLNQSGGELVKSSLEPSEVVWEIQGSHSWSGGSVTAQTTNDTILIGSNATQTISGDVELGGQGKMRNEGSSTWSAGNVQPGFISGTYENAGDLLVTANAVTFGGFFNNLPGGTVTVNATGSRVIENLNNQGGDFVVAAGTLVADFFSQSSGNTTVADGASLFRSGPSPTNELVFSGGRLEGNGSLGRVSMTTGATIAPGNSVGELIILEDLSFSSAAFYEWELAALVDNSDGTAGVDWDRLDVGGDVYASAVGSGSIQLQFLNGIDPDGGDPFWNSDRNWTIIISGGTGSDYTGLSVSSSPFAAGTFGLQASGSALELTWTAVPEPATLALLAMALFGWAAGLRKVRSN